MLSVFFIIFSLADIPMSLIEESFGWVGGQVETWIPTMRPSAWIWIPAVHRVVDGRVRDRVSR